MGRPVAGPFLGMSGVGELVSVHGRSAYVHWGRCPEELLGCRVQLESADGSSFDLSTEAACLSKFVTKAALASKSDIVVPVPVSADTLARVVEYLKHFADKKPSEVRTPLADDNLVGCGFTSWEAAFVNLPQDQLFEVMLAATVMDIPSLSFLAAAKATMTLRGKETSAILKASKLANDLPADESEVLDAAFRNCSARAGLEADESGVAAAATLLNGVFAAAERNGIYAQTPADEPGESSVSLKSYRHACWRALVLADWTLLSTAPEEVRADRELVYTAICSSKGRALEHADIALKADPTLVLEAVRRDGNCLALADPSLRAHRKFIKEAVAVNGSAFAGVSDDLKGDKDLLLDFCRMGQGSALVGASQELLLDRQFIIACSMRDPVAFKHAAEELQWDKAFCMELAKKVGRCLQYMPRPLRSDRDVVAAAVGNDRSAISFAHTAARLDLNMPLDHDSEVKHKFQKQTEEEASDGPGRKLLEVVPHFMGIPLTQATADDQGITGRVCRVKGQKIVQFSSIASMLAGAGQSNYVSANGYLDKQPFYERPETDAVTLMWGAVGYIGMRWKAFASADALSNEEGALLNVSETIKAMHVIAGVMNPPEWVGINHFNEWTRNAILAPSAGAIKSAPWGLNEDAVRIPRGGRDSPDTLEAEKLEKKAPGRSSKESRDKEAPRKPPVAASSPLGGWPALRAQEGPKGAGAVPSAAVPRPELSEGCSVLLQGAHSKAGTRGVALKRYKDGKWRVRLEGDKPGFALVEESYLVQEESVATQATKELVSGGSTAASEGMRESQRSEKVVPEPAGVVGAGRDAGQAQATAPWAQPPALALHFQHQGAQPMFGFIKGVKQAGQAVASH